MSEQDPNDPWEFPHEMKLKVMGPRDSPLESAVVAILNEHLDDFDPEKHMGLTESGKGNYISLTCHVVMRDKEQLLAIYRKLHECPHSRMVL
jgi:hypothetical protein